MKVVSSSLTPAIEDVHVSNCFEPQFNRQMIDSLVMDPSRVRTIKALAKSFVRIDKNGAPIVRDAWAADFVKGKGNGLIFLLHGRPGVGKTCTAGTFRWLGTQDNSTKWLKL